MRRRRTSRRADLDLFVANGHVIDVIAEADSAQTYRQPNQMFRNDGGRFEEVSAALGDGFSEHNVGRAAAVADFDNDGDIDLLVTTVSGRPRLLRNEGRKGHWLMLELTGGCHPDALGARVYVTTTAGTQVRERQSGGSYLSSHDPRLHFGLGDATHADVEVHWPDGEISHHGDVAADQILRLEHPGL